MFCNNCNKEMGHVEGKFCPHCATPQKIQTKKKLDKKTYLPLFIVYGITILIWIIMFVVDETNRPQLFRLINLGIWLFWPSFLILPATFCFSYFKGSHKKTLKAFAIIQTVILVPLGFLTFFTSCQGAGICLRGVIELLMFVHLLFSTLIVGLYSKFVLKNN